MQGHDGCWPLAWTGAEFRNDEWLLKLGQTNQSYGRVLRIDLASDYKTARVTKAQWQAERDRQKCGEWKRHRGGKRPVDPSVRVECRMRNGDVEESSAGGFMWDHNGAEDDVMKYRVISQPQAEEVEVKDTTIGTLSYKISVDQIAGPLAWRDTIIHCQAIIEDCEREIAKNENLLALEGFSLIPAMTPVAGVADVDMSDWRNWKRGDIVEVILPNDSGLDVGKQYTVSYIEKPDYIGGMHVNVVDETGADYWPEDDEYDGRLVFKFISRP